MTHKVFIPVICIVLLSHWSFEAEFDICPGSTNFIDPNNVWLEQPNCTCGTCILDLKNISNKDGEPEILAHWNLKMSDEVLNKPYFWFVVTLSLNGKNYTGKELHIKPEDVSDTNQVINEDIYVDLVVESQLPYFIFPQGNGTLYLEILLGDPDILNTIYYRYCVYRHVTVLPFNNLNYEDNE